MNARRLSWLRRIVPPVLFLVLVLVLWEAAVLWFQAPIYLLPGPLRVAQAALDNWSGIAQSTAITAVAAGCGFAASLVLGVIVALVFSQSQAIRSSCYPYAIFLQTVPIVAIAPLIITWFGYGFQSVVIVAFVISLFPIITNATAGMVAIDPLLLDLFHLHNATRWQILFKLRLPNSVPFVVTGAKTVQRPGRRGRDRRRVFRRCRHGPLRFGIPDTAETGAAADAGYVRGGDRLDAAGCGDFRFHQPGGSHGAGAMV